MSILQTESERVLEMGKASYICESGKGRVFVKEQPPVPKSLFRHLVRKMNGGSLPFENEQMIYSLMSSEQRESINAPGVVRSERGKYLALEYIEGLREPESLGLYPDVGKLIAIFNNMDLSPKRPLIKEVQFRVLESPMCKVIRAALRHGHRYLGWLNTSRVLISLLKLSARTRKPLQGVMLHNDINPNNVAVSSNEQLHLLDFEDAIFERKWVLVDIVDAAFDKTTLRFHRDVLERYWECASQAQSQILARIVDIQAQVRFALIRRILVLLGFRRTPEPEKPRLAQFLVAVVLDNSRFARWLSEQDVFTR